LKPWLGVALVLFGARALLAGANAYQRRHAPSAEAVRKALHVGLGTLLMAYPSLFDRTWPVWALACVFVGLLAVRRHFPPLHFHVAGVIYGVERESIGEFYFPVTAATLFTLSRGDGLLYGAPLALLVYADAAAALVGTRWGTVRYFAGRKGPAWKRSAPVASTISRCRSRASRRSRRSTEFGTVDVHLTCPSPCTTHL
jgi:phytol kinase